MPQPGTNQQEGGKHHRDAHDWVTLFILTLSLVTAACAAGFAGWQGWVARDQERRSLRAYVNLSIVPSPSLDEEGQPTFTFKLENMGQTPVYRLSILPSLKVRDDANLYDKAVSGDCAYVTSRPGGMNFGKGPVEETYGLDMNTISAQKILVKSGHYVVRIRA